MPPPKFFSTERSNCSCASAHSLCQQRISLSTSIGKLRTSSLACSRHQHRKGHQNDLVQSSCKQRARKTTIPEAREGPFRVACKHASKRVSSAAYSSGRQIAFAGSAGCAIPHWTFENARGTISRCSVVSGFECLNCVVRQPLSGPRVACTYVLPQARGSLQQRFRAG